MANNAQSFKAPQCEKRPQQTGTAAQKVSCRLFTRIQFVPATSSASAQNSFNAPLCRGYCFGKARRHELDKFREPVALVEAEFRSTLSRESLFWSATACANEAFGPSGVTQELLARSERCTLVSHYRDQVRRGTT
jgi:hypothetical protein